MRHDSRPPSVVVGGPDPRHRPGADRRRARNALDSAAVGLLDRLGAGILLVVLSPLIIALSIAIMLDSPGPPFFWSRIRDGQVPKDACRGGWASVDFAG